LARLSSPVNRTLAVVTFCSLLAVASNQGQTFEINGQPPQAPSTASKSKQGSPSSAQGIGWGSSIEVGRLSRAAEQALAHGNAGAAADYAARAVKAAPQDNRLWFLLGYTARMAGRNQQSIDAYQHVLAGEPNSVEGLSGLAQTYMRAGRSADAKALLLRVLAANPRRPIDLAMAGELFVQSGEFQRGVDLLQRAEAMRPDAHTELILAGAYLRMKQPERAKVLLDSARARGGKSNDVLRAIANYYREQRDYAAAIKSLNEVSRKTPDVLAEIGYTYAAAGDKKAAADTYVRAAGMAPNDVKIQLSAADALVMMDDAGDANKYLTRAEAIDPNSYRLHAIRAELARASKHTADAIREYEIALANMPAGGAPEGVLYPMQLRINLAEMYRDADNQEQAEAQIRLAEAAINKLDIQGPPRAQFLGMRASIENASGDYKSSENDLKEALQIDPDNIGLVIQYAALLWRAKRPDEAKKLYENALKRDPNNRFALESMGYLAREVGDNKTAEEFFRKFQARYPDDYAPYLALGDLYTATRRFSAAQENYETAYKFAPHNPEVIAGGANAGIESHQIELAAAWLARADGSVMDDPRVMREQERYLFHKGKFLESSQAGYKVLQKLPNDREGSVYLAYDLYNLGRYDESLALARKYEQVLPKEPNFPLLAGHAEKQVQLLAEAVDDYTRTINIDPNLDQAWINRGYVLNDMQNAEQAASDFQRVLKMEPGNGVAHLGLAFSYLQLHKGKMALEETDTAEKSLGESGSTHMARAGAYRQMRLLSNAEKEYRAALKYATDDLTLWLALADTLYNLRRYSESLEALKDALALSPDNAFIYGKMAHAYAKLHDREMTLRYVQAAEREDADSSSILLDTGDAMLTLGDEHAAMQRFEKALDAPDANRVDARLLIAKLMGQGGHWDDARQQISLAFAESRIGDAAPITTDNLISAANLFLAMHDFDLAQKYFLKAKDAGAGDQVVAIGLANVYLAQGETLSAQAQLASLGNPAEYANDFDYTLAMANVYRQQHDTYDALSAFARANMLSGQDTYAERGLQEIASEEGLQITDKVSVSTDLQVAPIFDDETIYTTYLRLNNTVPSAIPPHSLLETRWTSEYRVRESGLPVISGFFQIRNARGQYAVPNLFNFLRVDTWDYIMNGGLNPVLHLGRNTITFSTGLWFTARRDKLSPLELNQNLFRQYLYLQSNAFWNWISVRAAGIHESGPFTEQRLSSRDYYGSLEFRVGRPWGRTALITGWRGRDLRYNPRPQEWYQTSSYIGLERKFGDKLTLSAMEEYIRGWGVSFSKFGAGQAVRPAFQFDYKPSLRWVVSSNFAWSNGRTLHTYDNMQSGFFISYTKSLRRKISDGDGEVPVDYPLRFSIGLQQQNFYNFTGSGQAQYRPVFRLTLF
jgi:tetratricopeptide (TPR) repeat protein